MLVSSAEITTLLGKVEFPAYIHALSTGSVSHARKQLL